MVHSLTQIVTQHALERTRCRLSGERPLSGGCLFLGASARALESGKRLFGCESRTLGVALRWSWLGNKLFFGCSLSRPRRATHSLVTSTKEASGGRSRSFALGAKLHLSRSLARLHFCAAAAKLWSTHPTRCSEATAKCRVRRRPNSLIAEKADKDFVVGEQIGLSGVLRGMKAWVNKNKLAALLKQVGSDADSRVVFFRDISRGP